MQSKIFIQSLFLFVYHKITNVSFWCPRPDSNWHSETGKDFLTTTTFVATLQRVFAVWTIPSPVRCYVSSLYTFQNFFWLGSVLAVKPPPNLRSSTLRVSSEALKFFNSSPLCLPISPRGH